MIETLSAYLPSTALCSYSSLKELTLDNIGDIDLFTQTLRGIGPRLTAFSIRPARFNPIIPPFEEVCAVIADNCWNLRSLQLQNWYNLPETAYYLTCRLHMLEEVGLACEEEGELVVQFLQNCPRIRKLYVHCSVAMPMKEWNAIIALCVNLREFHLQLKNPVSMKEVLMNPDVPRKLLTQCKRLRVLKSRGCHWNVWHIRQFENELVKMKPDCFVSLFSIYLAKNMPN